MAKIKDSIAIVYRDPQTGESIQYVDQMVQDLQKEVTRLSEVIKQCYRRLSYVRDPHFIVRGVLVQLRYARVDACLRDVKPQELAQEIGRLNAILNRCHNELERMRTNHPVITKIVFELKFRQTPRKRGPERSWNNSKRTYREPDEQETREDPQND